MDCVVSYKEQTKCTHQNKDIKMLAVISKVSFLHSQVPKSCSIQMGDKICLWIPWMGQCKTVASLYVHAHTKQVS